MVTRDTFVPETLIYEGYTVEWKADKRKKTQAGQVVTFVLSRNNDFQNNIVYPQGFLVTSFGLLERRVCLFLT